MESPMSQETEGGLLPRASKELTQSNELQATQPCQQPHQELGGTSFPGQAFRWLQPGQHPAWSLSQDPAQEQPESGPMETAKVNVFVLSH